MRLLTHNMLQCPRTKAYPLSLTATTCDDVEVPFSESFIRRMLPRLDWKVFREAAQQLPDPETIQLLPDKAPQADELDEKGFKAIHRALLEWHVVDGFLEVEGGTRYNVNNGIPNLVITEVRQEEDVMTDGQPNEMNEPERDSENDKREKTISQQG